jgi:hypothetical protein
VLVAVETSMKPLPDCLHQLTAVWKCHLSLSQFRCVDWERAHSLNFLYHQILSQSRRATLKKFHFLLLSVRMASSSILELQRSEWPETLLMSSTKATLLKRRV